MIRKLFSVPPDVCTAVYAEASYETGIFKLQQKKLG
jgi:hypothetical protein